MGFMSELVTLIWLIVEQSAVEQPVQTRFQITRVPGTGRALPGEQRRLSAEPAAAAWHGEDAGAREDEQSLSLPAAKKKTKNIPLGWDVLADNPLALWEQSKPCLAVSPANLLLLI